MCPELEINKDKTEKELDQKKDQNNHQGEPENQTASKNTDAPNRLLYNMLIVRHETITPFLEPISVAPTKNTRTVQGMSPLGVPDHARIPKPNQTEPNRPNARGWGTIPQFGGIREAGRACEGTLLIARSFHETGGCGLELVAATTTKKNIDKKLKKKKTDHGRTKRGRANKDMHERGAVVIDGVSFRQRSTAVSPLGDDGGRCSNEIDQARHEHRLVVSHVRT